MLESQVQKIVEGIIGEDNILFSDSKRNPEAKRHADVVTKTQVIEIKRWPRILEAIGQLTIYKHIYPERELVLVFFDRDRKNYSFEVTILKKEGIIVKELVGEKLIEVQSFKDVVSVLPKPRLVIPPRERIYTIQITENNFRRVMDILDKWETHNKKMRERVELKCANTRFIRKRKPEFIIKEIVG